jgi:hypothetical protein
MLGAGTVINPIIKIVTVVAILAATYVFILKPVLDTTDRSFDAFGTGFGDLPARIQEDVDAALDASSSSVVLQNCIERALDGGQANPRQIDRCVARFAS